MKTFVIVVETAILSFILGGVAVLKAQEIREKEQLAAEQEAKENPEA